MTFSANVSAEAFARAALCVSTDKTRYYLSGVQIEPCKSGPGALMIATDGSAMVVIHDPLGFVEPDTSAIIALPPSLMKMCKGAERLEINGDQATVAGLTAHGVTVKDGTYPEWRRVMPQTRAPGAAEGVGFDPVVYGRLAKSLVAPYASKISPVSLFGESANSPHWMLGSDLNAIGVIMPCRQDRTLDAIPAFIA